jgi:Dolichyl-phosphate-mannose-protein mannosyltransferase
VVIFACSQILMFPFGRDQGVYGVIADTILRGGMLYRDAWDIHPPGIYLAFALSGWLFGHRMVALRILEVIGLLSLYFPFRIIGRDLYHSREAGTFGWALAALTYAMAEYWYTGQSESFGALITVWALALTIASAPPFGRVAAWIAMGFTFGMCFLFKPQLALTAIPCAAYAGWTEWRRTAVLSRALAPATIGALAALAPIAICAAWLWSRGAWNATYYTYVRYAPEYTALRLVTPRPISVLTLRTFILRMPAIVVAGLAAALFLQHRDGLRTPAALLVTSAIALQLAGVAVAGKLFPYHYFVAFILAAVAAGDGFAKLGERFEHGSLAFALVLTAATVLPAVALSVPAGKLRPAPGFAQFWRRSVIRTCWTLGIGPKISKRELDAALYNYYGTNLGDYEEAAAIIDATTRPDDPIFIWGAESVIYWLANRRPASHWVHDFPLRANWDQTQSRATLMRELEAAHPAVIVVEAGDVAPDIVGNYLDSTQSLRAFPALDVYLSRYFAPIAQVDKLTIWYRTRL